MSQAVASRSFGALVLLGAAFASAVACSSSTDRQCAIGADCASGACKADGTCVPMSAGSNDAGSNLTDGGSSISDGAPSFDGSTLACQSGDGGTLGHDNVPLAAGLTATFELATNETIDTAGTDNGDGSRTWDFTVSFASDQSVIVQTLSPTGAWWAGDFVSATYAAKLSNANATLGIFEYGANSLDLIGAASPTNDGMSETEVTYATPIPILAFPLHLGQTWSTSSNVTGTYQGLPGQFYTEQYDSSIDASGTVKTPYGTFGALRMGTLLTQQYGALTTKTRTYAWVTQCFGTIAKAVSTSMTNTGTPAENFTQAAELERLAP